MIIDCADLISSDYTREGNEPVYSDTVGQKLR